MRKIIGRYFSLWKAAGFLGLVIAMFFSYRFISAGPAADEVVEYSQEENERIGSGAETEFATSSEKTSHYNGKFRHTTRKRALSRNNYLRRSVQYLSVNSPVSGIFVSKGFRAYAWVYHRPSYYVHLFRYALF